MPEGLAQTMTDPGTRRSVAYLTSLRSPVSIVGQYHLIGPLYEPNGAPLVDPDSNWTSDRQSPMGGATSSPGAEWMQTLKDRPT